MTHNCKSKKPRKVKATIDGSERPNNDPNRSILYSPENVKKMTVESCRARLITQLVRGDISREFTSYFHGTKKDQTYPSYLVTSHKANFDKGRSAMPVYPVVSNLRWCPYVESTSISQTDVINSDKKYNCRCENCSTPTCPSRRSSSTTIQPKRFKDNIMTFCNRYTMTPNFIDASCGYAKCVTYVPETTDAAVTASVLGGRDPRRICLQTSSTKCNPVPILKKLEDDFNSYHKNCQIPFQLQHEAVRDTDEGEYYCEPNKSGYYKCSAKSKKSIHEYTDQSECASVNSDCTKSTTKRLLYNEGISDAISDYYPLCPAKKHSQADLNRESKVSVRSKCFHDIDCYIPHSHTSKSKYHRECNHSLSKPVYRGLETEEKYNLLRCPHLLKQGWGRASGPRCRPCIALPRKMLTSEKDIDAFIKVNRNVNK